MSRARGGRGAGGWGQQHRSYEDYDDGYVTPRSRGGSGRGHQQSFGDRNRPMQSDDGQLRNGQHPFQRIPSFGRDFPSGAPTAGTDYRGSFRTPRYQSAGSYRSNQPQQHQQQHQHQQHQHSGFASQRSASARSLTEGGGGVWCGGSGNGRQPSGNSRSRAPYIAPPAVVAPPPPPPPPPALLALPPPAVSSAITLPAPAPAPEESDAPNNPHFLTPSFPQPPRTRTDSSSSWALMVEASCQALEAVVGPLMEGALQELYGMSWEHEVGSLGLPLPPFSAASCAELVAGCKQLHDRLPITIHKRVEAVAKAARLLSSSPASLEPEDVTAAHGAMKGLVQDCVKALRLPSLLGGGSRQFRAFASELLPHAESALIYYDMLLADCAEAAAARHQARLAAAGEGAAAGAGAASEEPAAAWALVAVEG